MHTIGRINKSIYSCITEDIVTDEVIITDTIQYIVGNKLYRPQKNLDLKGRYYEVLAHQLSEANLFVSAINPKLWNVHSGIADIRIYVYQIVL